MGSLISRIRSWWLAATPGQRLGTIGGGALALVVIVLVASLAGKPRYTMLFGGLSAADQANVVGEVQAMGIPVQYDTSGTVEVPEGKAAEVRMRLATTGKLPKSAHAGSGDLAAMNLYTTPAVERERLRTILEGELAKSIETTPGISSARVHLTLGDPSPFGDQRREATASVNVVQGGSGSLTSDQSRGIAMLVANAVDGLSLKNVVVLNERMEALFNGSESVGTGHVAEKKIELERQVEKSEERKLQGVLDGMFGPGSTLVTVRAEVDLDEEDSTVTAHKVKDGAEVEIAKEKMAGGSDSGTRIPAGLAANGVPSTPAAPAASGSTGAYTNEVKRIEPGTVDTLTRRKKATGGMRRMLINVAANTSPFKEGAEADAFVTSVRTFVTNEFSNQTDGTAFKALVTPVKFDMSLRNKAAEDGKEASALARRQQMISLLPVAALLIVGFFIVRMLGKVARPTYAVTPEGIQIPLGSGAGLSSTPGLGNGSAGSPLQAALNQHFDADGNPLAHGRESGIEFESDDERIRISRIKERTSIPLEQIKQMSIERPEAVALLVKSWLMEGPSR
ncbi:MAG: hypothetical protein C4320_08415 [Armatimonadota bacterium]